MHVEVPDSSVDTQHVLVPHIPPLFVKYRNLKKKAENTFSKCDVLLYVSFRKTGGSVQRTILSVVVDGVCSVSGSMSLSCNK